MKASAGCRERRHADSQLWRADFLEFKICLLWKRATVPVSLTPGRCRSSGVRGCLIALGREVPRLRS